MNGGAREPDQADFDLERFIDMFDEALSSKDERVINALRSLMMIVTLTRPESRNPMRDRQLGPLRRLHEDVNHLNRRLNDVEDILRRTTRLPQEKAYHWEEQDKYTMVAAQQVAAKMDQDIINQMKDKARGLYHK